MTDERPGGVPDANGRPAPRRSRVADAPVDQEFVAPVSRSSRHHRSEPSAADGAEPTPPEAAVPDVAEAPTHAEARTQAEAPTQAEASKPTEPTTMDSAIPTTAPVIGPSEPPPASLAPAPPTRRERVVSLGIWAIAAGLVVGMVAIVSQEHSSGELFGAAPSSQGQSAP